MPSNFLTRCFSPNNWVNETSQPNKEGDNNQVFEYSKECQACTQVGVPVFHSTTSDGANQPEWQALAGSSLAPIHAPLPAHLHHHRPNRIHNSTCAPGPFGPVLDPRGKKVKRFNRVLLLARGLTLAIDPLFYYALSLSLGRGGVPCVHVDNTVAAIVIVARTCLDAVHLWHVWLQFRLAYVSRESLVVGCGKLVWDARAVASHYVKSLKGLWLDVFVILPLPQLILWFLVPKLVREDEINLALKIMLLIFLFQFLPKVYHGFCFMRRIRDVTGYIFGTVWWGFGLNLIAYLVVTHIIGGCWYMLAMQRIMTCLKQHGEANGNCSLTSSCSKDVCYKYMTAKAKFGNPCGNGSKLMEIPMCLDEGGPFNYGIYSQALLVVSNQSLAVKVFYPIYWGMLNLSSFGNNLDPTSNLAEVMFCISIVISGVALFTLLIGNVQIFLQVVLAKNEKIQLKHRDIEWWMQRRQLPSTLRHRVRRFDRKRWELMGIEDEMHWIQELPDGLRRDIKRFVCLDLIKKVPLFNILDDQILDSICDRVKPLIFPKHEKILREGEPVPWMIFIMSGRVERRQCLSRGRVAKSVLKPGGFLGDELVSWCLRRPFIDRLPASSATFVCMESAEAYGLDAHDLKCITDLFRYRFASKKIKQTLRYYSSNWRSWAAVRIQFAWRQNRVRFKDPVILLTTNGSIEDRLRQYATMFMSIRPHDHLE
ncbi:hypothetical protein Tsubulata_004061 [Turnera subulata]|uniref:Cyclic nucleotide-binding domain-containing protein n=1 Tax=Turnera subulata TaxID=218843 RepID=A0A9Q0F7D0_9ROSI|nr:hypothetical protein Tsubulata_004061 [Turnera subulata]